MSLAFLAKKPWHVARVDNVEKVWLAEQKKDEEDKRVAELKKQIDEEREIDDLRRLQRDQGLVTDPKQKVEWLYEGPGSARVEEYKLGKAYVATTAATELQKLEDKEAVGSTWLDKSSAANETFARVNEDPLYKMRHSEKVDRDNKVVKNPLVMKRIKQQLKDELREYEQRKRAKKEAKKATTKKKKKASKEKKKKKKKEKKEKRHQTSDDDDDGSSDDGGPTSPPSLDDSAAAAALSSSGVTGNYGLTKGASADGKTRDLGPPKALLEAREREEAARSATQRRRKTTLTDDERERRRVEMEADARTHERHRLERMRHHRKSAVAECLDEDAALQKRRRNNDDDSDSDDPDLPAPKFLREARSEAYGDKSTIDLAEAVSRHRNRHQPKAARAADFFDE
eukprot:CAMPEP_0118905174 /NCGR_PEP_ID=MMETSP1166-20130328/9314_1 /TAXON_ID=1104430 /ORGANISM="Chrysoreinhardia sp, Strain CCMP3193" /LENGTH=397 /DNA_ID=CAMNT_0006844443 /DNA_START=183 /DNA_END=1376 /DNA_ORIENTATION=-